MKFPKSIYIHIPFCKTKCPYCDFASWAKKEDLIEKYFIALKNEIKIKCETYKNFNAEFSSIETIFIGGGTPSLVPPEYYEDLFLLLKNFFNISKDAEITMELNPGTANVDFLREYKKLGVNRVSIGAQSFNENILNILGRKHSVEETIFAIEKVKEAGITNFNLDLIYAVPGLDLKTWEETILKAISFDPKHISAYSLTIESGTPFKNIYKDLKKLPTEDYSFEMYSKLCNILKEQNFIHYEISNFSKPNFECKHNLTYWNNNEYFAFGVGAHRYLNQLRTGNTKDLIQYIENSFGEIFYNFPLDYNFEKIMLTSRLNNGFEISLIESLTKKTKKETIEMLSNMSNEGYLELYENKIYLTDKGMFLNNEILLKLL